MTSIFENTKSKVTVHILHDDTLTEDNRKKFIRTAEKYSQGLELHDITAYKKRMDNDNVIRALKALTLGTLYRLCIPDVLDLERVIYLDSDLIVNLDINELWKIDTENYCLAGVKTHNEPRSEIVRDRLNGHSLSNHINAGVLIMNLPLIRKREDNLFAHAMEWFLRREHLVYKGDQDILNSLFHDSKKLIDRRFNIYCDKIDQSVENCIIHNTGTLLLRKVWGAFGLPVQRLYWKFYTLSAWGEGKTLQELVDVFAEATLKTRFSVLPYYHTHKIKCLKASLIAIPRRIFWSNQVALSLRYIVRDIYYRLKHKLTRR